MNIALVDDLQDELEELTVKLTEKLAALGRKDFKIYTYHSGEEFLEKWKSDYFDLIILDIFMGEISGIDVSREIRRHNKDVRLVFCTTSNDFAAESYEVGAHFYLHKPYSAERIEAMLSRLDLENYELRRTVTLPDNRKIILRNILYTSYSNHVVTVHTKQARTSDAILPREKLKTCFVNARF